MDSLKIKIFCSLISNVGKEMMMCFFTVLSHTKKSNMGFAKMLKTNLTPVRFLKDFNTNKS